MSLNFSQSSISSDVSSSSSLIKKAKVTIEPESDGKWMYCQVPNCHFWTRKQIRMERHERSHVPGDDKFYQCPECQLKICSLSKLLRHDRKFHTGFKDYECKICEAEVTDIAVHMRVSQMTNVACHTLFDLLVNKQLSFKGTLGTVSYVLYIFLILKWWGIFIKQLCKKYVNLKGYFA